MVLSSSDLHASITGVRIDSIRGVPDRKRSPIYWLLCLEAQDRAWLLPVRPATSQMSANFYNCPSQTVL